MTIRRTLVPVLFAALLVLSPGALAAQDGAMADDEASLMLVSAADADYADVAPGVHKAVLWGDDGAGAYGAFTHFVAGQENPMHMHPNDIRIVVLEGAYVYTPEEGDEVRVEAGSYFVVPAGVMHVSAGDEEAGALFYESGDEAFGMEISEE